MPDTRLADGAIRREVVGGDAVRLFTIVPVAVLVLSFAVGVTAIVSGSQSATARRRAVAEPPTGMDILNAYACGRGETKTILIRGVEDGFSPAGNEPGFLREGRVAAGNLPRQIAGQYDQVNMDQRVTDSFQVAGPYVRGLFLFRARALGDNANDGIGLGNLTVDAATSRFAPRAGRGMVEIQSDPVWTQTGDIYHAAIEDILVNRTYPDPPLPNASGSTPTYSVLSYLNEEDGPGWLDVSLQDDTAMDFMGLALCSAPAIKRGVTLAPTWPLEEGRQTMVGLACHNNREEEHACDPYVGDTLCTTALPVACLKPGDTPAPTDAGGRSLSSVWSGGRIAVTEPVVGTRFRSVRDVERFCAQRFGPGWRVAAIHDGYKFQSIDGLGDPRTIHGRVWVDIADQPHATCWARE